MIQSLRDDADPQKEIVKNRLKWSGKGMREADFQLGLKKDIIFIGEEEQKVIIMEAVTLGKSQRQETTRHVQGTVSRPAW